MRLLLVALMAVGVVSLGCGGEGEPEVEADIPVWVEDDARAHLRDYLISVAEDGPRQELLLLFIVAGAPDFEAVYKSDGWWEVSGGDLGRASRFVTTTPRAARRRGPEPISEDALLAIYAEVLGRPLPTPMPGPSPTPTPTWPAGPTPTPGPTPEPVRIMGPSEGVWLVSERTKSAMPQNDAAGLLHWCLIAGDRGLSNLCQ